MLAQALGARDVAMGIGAWRAIGDPQASRAWYTALAIADGVDIPVTALAGDGIPLASRVATTAIAIASTAIAVAYAASPE